MLNSPVKWLTLSFITGKYLASYFYFIFLSLKYGVRRAREEEKRQESEVERWARLDKRIERARTRHELARLVIGTIFLVSESAVAL